MGYSPLVLSTAAIRPRQRHEWLVEEIGRQYAQVDIVTPPRDDALFNEMTFYPWGGARLSILRSSAIKLERLARRIREVETDACFLVVLLSGKYRLRQQARDAIPNALCVAAAHRIKS